MLLDPVGDSVQLPTTVTRPLKQPMPSAAWSAS